MINDNQNNYDRSTIKVGTFFSGIGSPEKALERLKEEKYINDNDYIIRSVNEFMALKNLSLKEMKYKLYQKGIDKSLVEDYFCENYDDLYNYEIKSAKNIYIKKSKDMEFSDIKEFLYKKGYMLETIKEIEKDI